MIVCKYVQNKEWPLYEGQKTYFLQVQYSDERWGGQVPPTVVSNGEWCDLHGTGGALEKQEDGPRERPRAITKIETPHTQLN